MSTMNTRYQALASKPSLTRPSLGREGVAFGHNFLRDQFTIGTWLLFGASLQLCLIALPIRTSFKALPVLSLLLWKILITAMMGFGFMENAYMEHVVETKYTALVPDAQGDFTRASVGKGVGGAGKGICIFILGFRVNHPLSMAAPGALEIMKHFLAMRDNLEFNAAHNGFLGTEFLLNAGHRTSKSEIKSIWYFRSTDDVMAFAHSPVHRKGWETYNKTTKQYGHLGIMHEMYESPAGGWENVYVNHQPAGLASASFPLRYKDEGISWADPLVDARKGLMASTAGRLGNELDED